MTLSVAERFEAKVERIPESGCWIWMASLFPSGYGCFAESHRRSDRANRAAWKLFRGSIPPGMNVLHRCDVRCCVNPSHLFLGTYQDNADDMVAKNRQAKGVKAARSKLTEDQALSILQSKEILREAAKKYGVSMTQVSNIRRGITWKHLRPTTTPKGTP